MLSTARSVLHPRPSLHPCISLPSSLLLHALQPSSLARFLSSKEAVAPRRAKKRSNDAPLSAASSGAAMDTKFEPQIYETTNFCDHRGMQLVFLGTSSLPTITRNASCIALRLDGTAYIFDSGEGVQKQLNQTPFRQIAVDKIFITHMHGDHIFGLPGLLFSLSMKGSWKQQPLNIFGPQGLRSWIRINLKACYGRVPPKYAVHELIPEERTRKGPAKQKGFEDRHQDEIPGEDIYCSEDGLWHVVNDNKYSVKAGLLHHSVPCWGYVVEERTRPGRFSVERAQLAGVKAGRHYALLQGGHSVTLKHGKKVYPSDVLGPSRRGRKVVILGDTYDSRSLQQVAQGADLLVHECTILEQDAAEAIQKSHSTATMAGQFARTVDARCLVLTHFGCKYEGRADLVQDSVQAAQKAFGKKEVLAARDLFAVTIRQTDEPAQSIVGDCIA